MNLMNLQRQPYVPNLILINLDTNTSVDNGRHVDGSYFNMHDVNNHDGAVAVVAPTGNNLVDIDTMTNEAGGTTVFMGGSLMNLK